MQSPSPPPHGWRSCRTFRLCRSPALPNFTAEFYYGLLAPANTPRSIIDRLYKELRLVVTSDDVSKRIAADGGVPIAGTPEDYAANIAREEAKWAAVAKKLGVGPN